MAVPLPLSKPVTVVLNVIAVVVVAVATVPAKPLAETTDTVVTVPVVGVVQVGVAPVPADVKTCPVVPWLPSKLVVPVTLKLTKLPF